MQGNSTSNVLAALWRVSTMGGKSHQQLHRFPSKTESNGMKVSIAASRDARIENCDGFNGTAISGSCTEGLDGDGLREAEEGLKIEEEIGGEGIVQQVIKPLESAIKGFNHSMWYTYKREPCGFNIRPYYCSTPGPKHKTQVLTIATNCERGPLGEVRYQPCSDNLNKTDGACATQRDNDTRGGEHALCMYVCLSFDGRNYYKFPPAFLQEDTWLQNY
jgi:hypothetical protein